MPNALVKVIKDLAKKSITESDKQSLNDEFVRILADDTFDLNELDEKEDATPLIQAVRSELMGCVMQLVNTRRIDLSKPTSTGSTPLMAAAARGKTEIMGLLLERMPPADLWKTRQDTNTIDTIKKSNYEEVKNNPEQYANLGMATLPLPFSDNTALDYAAVSNKTAAINLIIDKDEEKNPHHYAHALLLAVSYGRAEATKTLLERKVIPNNKNLVFCALESEKAEDPKSVETTGDIVEMLIDHKADAKCLYENYAGNNPKLVILQIKHKLSTKEFNTLADPRYENDLIKLITLYQNTYTVHLRDKMCGLISRILYARYLHTKPQNENDLIGACEYWAKITNISHLEKMDADLVNQHIQKPPLWLSGSLYGKHKKTTLIQPDIKPLVNAEQLNTLIDNTLDYLKGRMSETRTRWWGYSNADFVARYDIAKTLTKLKVDYENDGKAEHLNNIVREINKALAKSEIKGRLCCSSHRFADHLKSIRAEVNELLHVPNKIRNNSEQTTDRTPLLSFSS